MMMEKEDRNADEFLLNLQQKSILVEQIEPECPETYFLNPRMGALLQEVYTSKIFSVCLPGNYARRAKINITLSRHHSHH